MASGGVGGLIKWIDRDDYRDLFAEYLGQHMFEACADHDVDPDDLPTLINQSLLNMLWGSAFEDFISSEFQDVPNPADDYLKRRGWKESAGDREYIAALRNSICSLYEVSDIVRDQGFLARDLIRGGEPVRVTERLATRSMKQWDRIATRIVTLRGKPQMSGGCLIFDRQTSEDLLRDMQKLQKKAPKEAARTLKAAGASAEQIDEVLAMTPEMVLRSTAHVFSYSWLYSALAKLRDATPPKLVNSDGDTIEWLTFHYPLTSEATPAKIRAALATIPALGKEEGDFWNWLELTPARPKGKKRPQAHSFVTTMDDGTIVLGNVELLKKELTLQVNSESRAERGRALLDAALAGLVRAPLLERETVTQMMAKPKSDKPPAPIEPPAGMSAADVREAIHRSMTEHYMKTLDERIPILGNKSPRQCAKTLKSRVKAVEWLKFLENSGASHPPGDPMHGYDYTWMWKELGLLSERL